MLTDIKIRQAKPREKPCKLADANGPAATCGGGEAAAGITAAGNDCASCGGSSGSGSDSTSPASSAPQSTLITKPTAINLYPSESANDSPLLRVVVTSVGSMTVNMALGFDTGSAGVTLSAQSIFLSSMVSASGFVFPAGQSSITYNGITVTSLQGTRSYGTVNQTVEHGNLGFAELTFGDASGTVTTQIMPIFLFYSIDDTTGNGFAPTSY